MDFCELYRARKDLPLYFSKRENGNPRRPLSPLEELIVTLSDNINEKQFVQVCGHLTILLKNPEKLRFVVQLLHGVWKRGRKILYTKPGRPIPEQVQRAGIEVTKVALANVKRLNRAMKEWKV